jgi:shikimate dehydrogenase
MMSEFGLLGHSIGHSMAPMLHETLGKLTGRDVRYPLHDHLVTELPDIAGFLESLAAKGVTGINVTHPFKELVAPLVSIDDPVVQALGAVNTIRFEAGTMKGFNTDYTGMAQAYRERFSDQLPGVVALLGAGGFGKAAIFAMADVGAAVIHLYDPDANRAKSLADAVQAVTASTVQLFDSAEAAVDGVHGVLNGSPIGMYLYPGCPVDPRALTGARWVFDAVYAPLETEFLNNAAALGAITMSGSELFFWQGIHAFEIFTGETLRPDIIQAADAIVQKEIARRVASGR